jgi:ribosome biogenesis protein NSA1
LFALDLRTGRVLYGYNGTLTRLRFDASHLNHRTGIAGAISSLSSTTSSLSPPLLASTSLDRFFRLHSAYQPPQNTGAPVDQKGEVLVKVWVKSAAGCVAWDGRADVVSVRDEQAEGEDEEEGDVWAGMQDVGEDENDYSNSSQSEDEGRIQKNKKRKTR